MVDFRFYLNKQGIRGAKGETGDKGYSPEIVVDTETINEYKLRIINENNEIVTPNLRGNAIEVTDPEGDIVKYNKVTKNFYVGTIGIATANEYGIIRLANEDDIILSSNNTAITPANMSRAITESMTSPDDSVRIFNNPETHKTELTVDTGSISSLETRVEHLEDDALYLENAVNDLSTGLATTNSNVSALNTSLNGVRSDLTTESQVRLNADTQQQEAIDAERQQREIQDASLQSQLNTKLTVDNIKEGTNITITKDGNNVTINSSRGVEIDDTDPATDKVYSSSKTSDLVGELGNEVNSIAGRLNTLEGEVKVATTENLGLVQPDGTTITIDSDGKISAVGDITAAGDNTFTGLNTFDQQIQAKSGLRLYNDYASSTRDIYLNSAGSLQLGDRLTLSEIDIDGDMYTSDTFGIRNAVTGNYYLDQGSVTAGSNVSIEKSGKNIVISASGVDPEIETRVENLEEKVEELQLYKFPNATIEGDPTINNGQVSNFSTTNYLRFPFEFKTEGRTWLLNGSFDTDNDVTNQQNIIDSLASVALAVRNGRLVLALSTNGTSFNLGEHLSMSDILANTKYYYRLSFSGTQYLLSISTDKQEWLPEIVVASDQPIASKPMTISSPGHPFKGTINLNDYDLTVGNILVWQGMDDVGIASRMDVNASNITQTGIDKLKELLLGDVEALVDAINVNYESSSESVLAATPMMLSLEDTELDVENSFTSNKSKAVFSEDIQITPLKEESYDDDTDIDFGGNE